jgi:hypothetical protein
MGSTIASDKQKILWLLFNHGNVAQINPVFGSNLTPIAGFEQPIQGIGARQIQFSLDFEF